MTTPAATGASINTAGVNSLLNSSREGTIAGQPLRHILFKSGTTSPEHTYFTASSPFAESAALSSDVRAWRIAVPTQEASGALQLQQQKKANDVILNAIGTGKGVFQFVSPAAHHGHMSRDFPIASYIRARLGSGPHTQAFEIGNFIITGLRETTPADGPPHTKTFELECTHKDAPDDDRRTIPITQVGLSYREQFFDVQALTAVHTQYERHCANQRAQAAEPDDFPQSPITLHPAIISFGGIGRNAALITLSESLRQLRQMLTTGTTIDQDIIEQTVNNVIEHCRLQTGNRRFMHNPEQTKHITQLLHQELSAIGDKMPPHDAAEPLPLQTRRPRNAGLSVLAEEPLPGLGTQTSPRLQRLKELENELKAFVNSPQKEYAQFKEYLQLAETIFNMAQKRDLDLTNQDTVRRLSAVLNQHIRNTNAHYQNREKQDQDNIKALLENFKRAIQDKATPKKYENRLNKIERHFKIKQGLTTPVRFIQALWSVRLLQDDRLSTNQRSAAGAQLESAMEQLWGPMAIRIANATDTEQRPEYCNTITDFLLEEDYKVSRKSLKALTKQITTDSKKKPPRPAAITLQEAKQFVEEALNSLKP